MKLYFRDLPCYQNLNPEQKSHKLYSPDNAFNLQRLPNSDLGNAFAAFIFDRAANLSFLSLRSEQGQFHALSDFLSDMYPDIKTLTDIPEEELHRKLKVWLLKNGMALTYERSRPEMGKTYREDNPVHRYLSKAYEYFTPKDVSYFNKENDIWNLKEIPINTRDSPIHNTLTLNFTGFMQDGIKAEVKECCLYRLKRYALRTVTQEISAIRCLSEYLKDNFPVVTSLKDFNRELLEEYLSYLYLEDTRRNDYRCELYHLKSVLSTIGRLFSYDALRGIFLSSDFSKRKNVIFKSYSDAELERFHKAYRHLDKQTARLLILHELLGLRISDTLTLRKEDVFLSEKPHIRVTQQKTGVTFEKSINEEIITLLSRSIKDTYDRYGECEYIFVCDKDPSRPMQYSALYYRLRSLIAEYDLRDDTGNFFTVGTHLFRHTYGKKLCDLLSDDATIAALLGHSSLSTVAHYRRMSPTALAENTKPVIDARNEKIKKFKKGWMT